MTGSLALITGCSSGLGLALGHTFAAHGYDLVATPERSKDEH